MTQCEQILDYIKANGSITAMDAVGFGCMRLASRVNDLKKLGVPIERRMESRTNAQGKKKTFARYYMA